VPSVFFRNSILEQQVILDHSLNCSTALRINENLKNKTTNFHQLPKKQRTAARGSAASSGLPQPAASAAASRPVASTGRRRLFSPGILYNATKDL